MVEDYWLLTNYSYFWSESACSSILLLMGNYHELLLLDSKNSWISSGILSYWGFCKGSNILSEELFYLVWSNITVYSDSKC